MNPPPPNNESSPLLHIGITIGGFNIWGAGGIYYKGGREGVQLLGVGGCSHAIFELTLQRVIIWSIYLIGTTVGYGV